MSGNGVPGIQPPMGERQPLGGGQYAPMVPGQQQPAMAQAPVPPAQPGGPPAWAGGAQSAAPVEQPRYPAFKDEQQKAMLYNACQAIATGVVKDPAQEVLPYFSDPAGTSWTLEHVWAFAADSGLQLPPLGQPQQVPASAAAQSAPAPQPQQAAPQTAAPAADKPRRSRLNKKEDLPKIEALLREGVTDANEIGARIGLNTASVEKQLPKLLEKIKQEHAQQTAGGYVEPTQAPQAASEVVPGARFRGEASAPPPDLVAAVKARALDLRWDNLRGEWEVVQPKTIAQAPATAVETKVVEGQVPASVARAGYACLNVHHLAQQTGLTFGEICAAADLLDSAEPSNA